MHNPSKRRVHFMFVGGFLSDVFLDPRSDFVIPAKAGIQESQEESPLRAWSKAPPCCQTRLDSRLRGND